MSENQNREIKPDIHPQEELPLAVVQGQALDTLPKDLYIPPQALEVFLEAFEGPLDLLLYLIRKENLDITDIPVADITRQYVVYIELMQEMQLELAGEYLVMSAMLAEIKSRMLLPRRRKKTPVPSWCGACRRTNVTSRRPKTLTRCRDWDATCSRRVPRAPGRRSSSCRRK